jgi:hypothetical protein
MKLRTFRPRLAPLPLKAAYGLHLIKMCREADALGAEMGTFIDITPPTLDEFKRMRVAHGGKSIYKGKK